MDVTLSQLSQGLIGYKSAAYAQWNAPLFQSSAPNDADWSGLYVAESESVAEGYVPDLADEKTGSGTGYVHKVGLTKGLPLINCLDEKFKDGSLGPADMAALRAAVRAQGVAVDDGPFMPSLGALGYCFRCYNNEEGGVEVIVPVVLTGNVIMQPYKRCTIKNYVASCAQV